MQLLVDRGSDQIAVSLYEQAEGDTLVIIFTAMGVPAGYYERFAVALNAAGFGAAVADLRGTGASRPRPSRASRYGYDELTGDVGAVLEALAPHRDGRRTILLGHSLGGQLCLMHLARSADDVDGVILLAVGVPYWRTYGRQRLGVLGFVAGIDACSAVLRVWPGWGFGGRQARGVMRDWAYSGRHGVFPPHLGVEEKLRDIAVPVLAISVDNDQYTPPATIDRFAGKLTSAQVRREHFTRDAAGIEIDHFKWVKAGEPLTKLIIDWQLALESEG